MTSRNQISNLIQSKIDESQRRLARQDTLTKTAAASAQLEEASAASKLAMVFERLALNPGEVTKVAEMGTGTGTNDPAVQPPTDEAKDVTSVQTTSQEQNSLTTPKGTESVPATNETEADTLATNEGPIAAVTETPTGIPDKIAAAENESESSPREYAAGEKPPGAPSIPFLDSGAAAQAFKKRQAKQVSTVGTLEGLFEASPYSDPVLHQQFTNAEAAGVKTTRG